MKRFEHLTKDKSGIVDPDLWLQNVLAKEQYRESKLLPQAVRILELVGEEKLNPYRKSCIEQGLIMATILSELGVDEQTLVAALLYSSVQYAGLSLENVAEHLGDKIAKLVSGTKQMEAISDFYKVMAQGELYHHNVDNVRKMFLAMVDDVRVVLLKLAERLYVLRCAAKLNNEERLSLAKEASSVYAPLANRLGISPIKWEMEDLVFRYLEPEKYYEISKSLSESRIEREKYITEFIATIEDILRKSGIKNFEVTGRVKHIYSIYRKMCRKQVGVKGIYDVNAVRVFVANVEDCYAALGTVHGKWDHIPQEFDDYITNPKPNGYSSIHTAIIGPQDKIVEVQIRTQAMHDQAELGVAAHWLYKEGAAPKSGYEEKIALLRQLMDWQKEVGDEKTQQQIQHIFSDHIYVFTPAGDVLDLPQDATPLDFAYRVHSEVGHRCIGAKVNGAIVPLNYKLKSGEKVDILTGKRGQPSRDWLNSELGFLKTAHAKAKVFAWFKKQSFDSNAAVGQELLEKELRRLGLKQVNLEELANKLKFKNKDEFMAVLGRGDLKISNVVEALNISLGKEKEVENEIELAKKALAQKPTKKSGLANAVKIQGVDNLLTNIANCCKPVPGDRIVGYITQGEGISIHREDCSNMLYARKVRPERIMFVSWGETAKKLYPVDVVVEAFDRQGLVRDITGIFADAEIMVLGLQLSTNKKEHTAHVNLTIEIENLEMLSKVLAKVAHIPNVSKVWRKI